jgi:hypothetical protein
VKLFTVFGSTYKSVSEGMVLGHSLASQHYLHLHINTHRHTCNVLTTGAASALQPDDEKPEPSTGERPLSTAAQTRQNAAQTVTTAKNMHGRNWQQGNLGEMT